MTGPIQAAIVAPLAALRTAIRLWFKRVHLNALRHDIAATTEDILDATQDGDHDLVDDLLLYHAALCRHADRLEDEIAALQP